MAIEGLAFKVETERKLVLMLIAFDCVGRADAFRPVPDHVVVPGSGERFWWDTVVTGFLGVLVRRTEIRHHCVDQLHRLFAVGRIVGVEQNSVVGLRPGIEERRPGLGWQGIYTRLPHDAEKVEKTARFQ